MTETKLAGDNAKLNKARLSSMQSELIQDGDSIDEYTEGSESDGGGVSSDEDDAINDSEHTSGVDKDQEIDEKDDSESDGNDDAFGDDQTKLESFDMKKEYASGEVDQSGNMVISYVKDRSVSEDHWLDEFSSKDSITKTRKAHDNLAQQQRRKRQRPLYMLDEALEQLYYFVPKEETVEQALVTYQHLRKRMSKEHTRYVANAIQTVLNLTTVLEQKGVESVMQLSKEAIKGLYLEERLSGTLTDDVETKQWCFKWLTDLESLHEPFSNYEMQSWKDTYFNSRVIVRRRLDSNDESNWYHIDCLSFM